MANDPYQELGVSRTADADAIRKSFRKLAKELHPDRNPGDAKAEERFKRVSAAFDLLGDPEKKAKFDRGEIDADGRETMRGFDPRGAGGGGFGGGGPGGFGGRFEGADLEDIFEMFGRGGGGDGRGGGFGGFGGGGRSSGPARGQDVRSRLEIDLEEAIRGGSKRVAFPDGRMLDVTIPKGAYDGQTLRLKGQGRAGRSAATAGDALIELAVRPHPLFHADGADLRMDLPVSLPDAVLGAKVAAPTPEGEVQLTVPRRSSSGAVLRLKGRGGVDPQTGRRGDLFARLMIMLPDKDDPALDSLAEEIRRERPYAPRRR
ncbi:MAG: J domain-containing protein [Caulobacteraceae bacterium]|nr:J domain-containing protein [Caulobacter sp.]